MTRRRLALLTLAVVLLAPVSGAQASDYSRVLQSYQQNGSVPPCRFTTSQLSGALKGVNLYGAQYFADFTAAIRNALSARAGGSCLTHPVRAGGVPGGPPANSNLGLPPGTVTAPTQAGVPAPILLLGALAAALALISAFTALARWRGTEGLFLPWWRHLWKESGYRAGGVWAEFVDWLRSA
ncbi:MAG: hypothetical protein QOD66_3813 [Solirubrobacteraceae bacterium]|nr:hypothetical protein [Solirubrobacteraceae bacterium]